MRRSLPRLEQIEAFVEAARAPSFRVAAERCSLSPAAFSRRIQALSEHVGVTLFERTAGGARLTEAGQRCFEELSPGYLELRRAAEAIGRRQAGAVVISLSHSLAVGWLIPRLETFRAEQPDIDVAIRTHRGADAIRCGEADLGLCFTDIDLDGLVNVPLLDVSATPVASPTMAARLADRPIATEHLLSLTRPTNLWDWWATETGYAITSGPVSRFELIHATYESASEGLGVAMGASPTVWPYLTSGRLQRIGLPVARFPGGYRLAGAAERIRRRPVAAMWRWLEREAAATPQLG